MAKGYHVVQRTSELKRILTIPRRSWSDEHVHDLTAALRTNQGTQTLRPIQAQILFELGTKGGAFGPIKVSGGKTLVSLLAPAVTCAKRPLLLVPAKLREKTRIEAWVGRMLPDGTRIEPLCFHWRIPRHIRIESYEQLQTAGSSSMLMHYRPDLVILDEAHKVRRISDAARAKRVRRYVEDVGCSVLAMSGSFTNGSIKDLADLLAWCVADYPLPRVWSELQDWSDACEEDSKCGVGALSDLGAFDAKSARQAIQKRINETAGVVASADQSLGVSLNVCEVNIPAHPEILEGFKHLRGVVGNDRYPGWMRPDGWPLQDKIAIGALAQQLSLGFYYVWFPEPPKEWLVPRKRWNQVCRRILRTNRRELDSELQVIQEIRRGGYDGHTLEIDGKEVVVTEVLEAWKRVEDTFEPNVKPIWLGDAVIRQCAEWLKGGGMVWVKHVHFGLALEAKTGLPYFGDEGRDRNGNFIEDHHGKPCIASIESNFEGRNLQAWNRALITCPPASGDRWEQLLGRFHRDGQKADEVTYDVLNGCAEHIDAFEKAQMKAGKIQDLTGQEQKLCYASVSYGNRERDIRYER